MQKQRLDFIDFTRGIAASAVLMSHAGAATGHFTQFGFGYDWLNLGQVGIIAFFAVSGFVIPLSMAHSKNMLSFGIRRIFRIYPLFMAMLLMAIFFHTMGVDYPSAINEDLTKTILANLAFVAEYTRYPSLVNSSWTLSIEIVWYVGFAVAVLLGAHRRPLLLASAVSASFVCIAGLSMLLHARFPLGRFGMLGACLIGYCFYKYFEGQIDKTTFRSCLVVLMASIFLLLWTSFYYFEANGTTFRCVLISWTTGFMIFYIPFKNRERRFFQLPAFMMLGRYSYSIYLVHPLAIFFCLHFLHDPAIQLSCIIASSFVISFATFNLIEAPGIWAGKTIDRFFNSRKLSRYSPGNT